MKTLYISVFALIFSANLSSQTINQEELNQFYEKQQTPFIGAEGETFVLNGISWERAFGENEYVLTPVMKDINEYNSRIKKLDDYSSGIIKSNFHFIKVDISSKSKSILKTMGIEIPNYIQNEVNVYLPEIDIDKLSQENIVFSYLNNYGTKKVKTISDKKATVTLFSDDFEINPITTQFTVQNGAVNCGWKDISCNDHNGSWSVWCAADGAACNANCADYVSNMDAQFWSSNFINTTGHSNITINFWLSFDMNNTGTNDELKRYYDIGSGWQLSSFSYNSSHSDDGLGWRYRSFNLSGTVTQYAFLFQFVSNSVGNSNGVFIDEIEVTGDNSVGVDEINLTNSISIYPNPTNGIFSIEAENMERIEITTITGEIVKELIVNKNKTTIDLTSFSSGIYFAKVITDKGSAIKKIVLN